MSMQAPCALANNSNACFLNSLFQCLMWNPYYRNILIGNYLPERLHAWRGLARAYVDASSTGNEKVKELISQFQTHLLRYGVLENHQSMRQEDSHEVLMKIIEALPDGTSKLCGLHRQEGMKMKIPNNTVSATCIHPNCTQKSSFYFDDINVVHQATITSFLFAVKPVENVISNNNVKPQWTTVSYKTIEQDSRPLELCYITKLQSFEQISLHFSDNSSSLDDMINAFICNLIYKEHNSLKGLDKNGILTEFDIIAQRIQFQQKDIPESLIVHLVRFGYNSQTNQLEKINKPVDIPLVYDFECLFDDGVDDDDDKEEEQKEELVSKADMYQYEVGSFLVHYGNQMQGGHYVAFVCTSQIGTPMEKKIWYCCDDTKITLVTIQMVQQHLKQAYLVFFNKSNKLNNLPAS